MGYSDLFLGVWVLRKAKWKMENGQNFATMVQKITINSKFKLWLFFEMTHNHIICGDLKALDFLFFGVKIGCKQLLNGLKSWSMANFLDCNCEEETHFSRVFSKWEEKIFSWVLSLFTILISFPSIFFFYPKRRKCHSSIFSLPIFFSLIFSASK